MLRPAIRITVSTSEDVEAQQSWPSD